MQHDFQFDESNLVDLEKDDMSNHSDGELIRNEKYYQFITETIIDVIWFFDLKKNGFTYISPSVKKLLGYTAEEMLQLPIHETLTRNSLDTILDHARQQVYAVVGKNKTTPKTFRLEIEEIRKDGSTVWCEIRAIPVEDEASNLNGMLGVTRDISDRKKMDAELGRVPEQLKQEVKKQTAQLNEVNTALNVLLRKKDDALKQLEETVHANVREMISPLLEKFTATRLTSEQTEYLTLLKSNLNEIVSPIARNLSSEFTQLSPTEMQVANLVKQGKQSKEIAEFLSLSPKTVEFHRDNIRSKLGIKKKKINLRSYLLSLK